MFDHLQIEEAYTKIKPYIVETPLIYSEALSRYFNGEVFLKCENFQKTGSFKVRGAMNKILSLTEKELNNGIIAASAGNHAQGVAAACELLNIECTIVMPKTSPIVKIENTKQRGAKIILEGNFFDEAYAKAREIEKETNKYFVHPFADDAIMAGQGTVGIEILNQIQVPVDHCLIPVGGGGLCSGIATYLKAKTPRTRILGIGAKNAPSVIESIQTGSKTIKDSQKTLADGLSVKTVDEKIIQYLHKVLDEAVLVEEEGIIDGMALFMDKTKMLVEGAGAVGLAYMYLHKREFKGKTTVLVVSGGNVDLSISGAIAERALYKSSRHVKLHLEISDLPGSLAKVIAAIARNDGNILHIYQERIIPSNIDFYHREVEVDIEVAGPEHRDRVIKGLTEESIVYKIL